MTAITRLEKTFYRLHAQLLCLDWAFEQIDSIPGVIMEIGLGHGRTYQYIKQHLPERELIVFERDVKSYEDCTPPGSELIIGDINSTLATNANHFKHSAALVNSDVGSFDKITNLEKAALISQLIPAYLAKNAIVLSDLPLELEGCTALKLPDDARKDSYYLYKNSATI